MAEVTRGAVARVGVDLFKRVFQVHAVDSSGRVVTAKPMAPDRFLPGAPSCQPAAWLGWKPVALPLTWRVGCWAWVCRLGCAAPGAGRGA
jgi:hypothetical protein